MNIPAKIYAGNTLKFTDTLSDYSAADGWTLAYYIVGTVDQPTFSSTPSGRDFSFTVDAVTTGTLAPGVHAYQAKVSKAGEVYTVDEGIFSIVQDFAKATAAFDPRSPVRIAFENVTAMMQGRATKEEASYMIAGRSLSRLTPKEVMDWYYRLKAAVEKEELDDLQASGKNSSNVIRAKFV